MNVRKTVLKSESEFAVLDNRRDSVLPGNARFRAALLNQPLSKSPVLGKDFS